MAVTTKWRSDKPTNPKLGAIKRYVRRGTVGPGYAWCEKQTRSRYDMAQGECDAQDLPERIRKEADARRGEGFGYVEWPFDI